VKLVSFSRHGQPRLGTVCSKGVLDLVKAANDRGIRSELPHDGDAVELLRGGEPLLDVVREVEQWALETGWDGMISLGGVELMAPIQHPPKFLCMAANYGKHVTESGRLLLDKANRIPRFFLKPTSTIIAPEAPIQLPTQLGTSVDYEGELGIVIGRPGANIPFESAKDYVAGYLNVNDVSARRIVLKGRERAEGWDDFFDWLWGKWFDSFGPIGPYLVVDDFTLSEAVRVTTRVNGELRQDAAATDMIYTIEESISWINRFVTLEVGDIISMGTPSGVGSATGTFLGHGDLVEVEVTGLGVLRNPVI